MAKVFAGFTPEQMGKIVPEMKGMQADEQKKFLAANPAAAARVGKMFEAAQKRVSMAYGGYVKGYAEGGPTEPERPDNPLAGQGIPFDTTYGGASTPENQLKSGPPASGQYPGGGEVGINPPWSGLQPPTGGFEVEIDTPNYTKPGEQVTPAPELPRPLPSRPPVVTPPAQPEYDYSVTRPYLQGDPTSPDYVPGQSLTAGVTAFDPQAYTKYITQKYDFEGLQAAAQAEQDQALLGAFGDTPIDEQGNVAFTNFTQDLTPEAKEALKQVDLTDPKAVADFLSGPGSYADATAAANAASVYKDQAPTNEAYVAQYDTDGDGVITDNDVERIRSGQKKVRTNAAMNMQRTFESSSAYQAIQEASQEANQEMTANPEYQDFIQQLQQNREQGQALNQGARDVLAGVIQDPASQVARPDVVTTSEQQRQQGQVAEGTGQLGEFEGYSAAELQRAADATAPDAPEVSTYLASQQESAVREAAGELDAARGDVTREVTPQEGTLSPAAQANGVTFDDKYLDEVTSGDRVVESDELAEAQGLDEEAVKAKFAEANVPENIQAAQTSVQPNEIPQPAQIAESDMAQAQVITDEGLNDDAIAVAAKLKAFSVDDGTLAEFKEGKIEAQDTVQGQLSNLMKSFDDGTPAWAAGAMRAANAAMASRGLGGSSMAAAAIVQSAMESAIPIASADAAAFREMKLDNLNRQQQVSLANAAAQQGVKLANFNAEQQTALQNSQNAFALQSQNLSNMQQTMIANAQIKASLQGQNLSNQQQANMAEAARYAEVNNLNLNNRQQGIMQDSLNNLQVELANLNTKQQSYIANANLEAALQGKKIDNQQQVAITNAAKFADANNLTFTAGQQAQLHNSELLKTIGLAELNSEQAAVLQNAAQAASMDMANLNNRQQAQVENARSFLQMDLSNLTNEQQAVMFKTQSIVQSLFNDQAAENASLQFNSSSENQTNQWFADLATRVSTFVQDQNNTMNRFEAGEENAIAQFLSNIANSRDQFNANNALETAQSNAAWAQKITTTDNAEQNEANRTAALTENQFTALAYNSVIQQIRDTVSYAWQTYNNDADRATSIITSGIAADATEYASDAAASARANEANANRSSSFWETLGTFGAAVWR